MLLRAKGILRGPDGYVNVQYLPGDLRIADCAVAGGLLCLIGRNLDPTALKRLFN